MAKRKQTKSKVGSSILNYIAWGLAIFALALSSLVTGYYFGYEDAKESMIQKRILKNKKD